MNGEGASAKVLDRNEEPVTRHWRKGQSYYKVTERLTESCFTVGWKVELGS